MDRVRSPYTDKQISAWLRGLLSVAWADGRFEESEKELVRRITHDELMGDELAIDAPHEVEPQELQEAFGNNPEMAENFLRTAVMVALADGIYTETEDRKLRQLCEALGREVGAIASLRHILQASDTILEVADLEGDASDAPQQEHLKIAETATTAEAANLEPLKPVRQWLDDLDIHDPKVAHFICKTIPPQCPFERDVVLFGRKVMHIPAMCKLNPLYEQLVGLRFRALNYLAEECDEDVSSYC